MNAADFTNGSGTTIRGGAGGTGGAGGSSVGGGVGGNGGNGGKGGAGLSAVSTIILNAGAILGGNGGIAGADATGSIGSPGTAGGGGYGITGSNLTVINGGTISGGLASGCAGVRADAINLTGGTNFLTLTASGFTGVLQWRHRHFWITVDRPRHHGGQRHAEQCHS